MSPIRVLMLVALAGITVSARGKSLNEFRLERVSARSDVQRDHAAFVEKAEAILEAPLQATVDKLIEYTDCRSFQRNVNKVGKMGTVDLAEAICADSTVQAKEARILKERGQQNAELAKLERSTRVVGLLSSSYREWDAFLRSIAPVFGKRCQRRDEHCLEAKQLARAQQLHATAVTRLNLRHLRGSLPKLGIEPYAKDLEKALLR